LVVLRGGLRDLVAGPGGELACGHRRASEDLRDGGEVDAEAVVQDERHPLAGAEPVQNDLQRDAHRVGQSDLVGRVGRRLADVDLLHGQRGLGPQPVQAQPGGDGGQPPRQVLDVGAGAVQAQPGLLDDVFGLGRVAQEAAGDTQQSRSLGLIAHRLVVHSGHTPSVWSVRKVTHAGWSV